MSTFVGREKEREKLLNWWKEAQKGKPQIVTLIADTGVGKTRLVQELYEEIARQHQSSCDKSTPYWPASLGEARQRTVNPKTESFSAIRDRGQVQIPYLWWGMYWTDQPNETGTAFIDSSHILDQHLKVLALDSRWSYVGKFFGISLEEGIQSAAQTAAEAAGAAVAAEAVPLLGKAVKGVRAVLSHHRERQITAKSGAERVIHNGEEAGNRVLAGLKEIFESKSPIPLLLFADDIHFSKADQESLVFLEILINMARSKGWPLMVVATHWKAQWNEDSEASGPSISKSWRRITEALTSIDSVTADAGKGIGVHHISLKNMERPELKTIALSRNPKLSAEDINSILDRVDNPRWLTEVLLALNKNAYFDSTDQGVGLNDVGRARRDKALEAQDYLGVIRDRLDHPDMKDVCIVLSTMANYAYGLEFLTDLAESLQPELVDRKLLPEERGSTGRIKDILKRALDPAALIDGQMVGDAISGPVRFPERGYLEVAREFAPVEHIDGLRRTLGYFLIGLFQPDAQGIAKWKSKFEDALSKRVFLGTSVGVLQRLVPKFSESQELERANLANALAEAVADGDMTPQIRDKRLAKKDEELLASNPNNVHEAARYHVLAMVELIALLGSEGRSDALALGNELASLPGLDLETAEWPDHCLEHVLLVWAYDADHWPLARRLIRASITRLDRQLQQVQVTPERLSDKASFIQRLADLDEAAGDATTARRGVEQVLAILDRLLSHFGETPERLRDKAMALRRLAYLDEAAGGALAARRGFEQGLAIWERLLTDFGETPERLRGKAIYLERLAILHDSADDVPAARH